MVLKNFVRCVSIGMSSTLLLVTLAHGQVNRSVNAVAGDSDSVTPAPGTRA